LIHQIDSRHASSGHDHKTTLILLCEDGSLKIFMANTEATNFWLTPVTHPMSAIMQAKPPRKKKARALRDRFYETSFRPKSFQKK
jgi:E3 ubiquitin-protein ligase UBR4